MKGCALSKRFDNSYSEMTFETLKSFGLQNLSSFEKFQNYCWLFGSLTSSLGKF